MKLIHINPLFGLKLSALVVGLFVTTAVHATTVPTPGAGDIFLGFRASGGQGGSVSYLVNIGNDVTYRNAPVGTSFTVSGLGDIGADLVSTFGINWKTRADLYWGIFGTRVGVSSTVYGSREQSPFGTYTSAWDPLDSTGRNVTSSNISSVISGVGGYTGGDATINSSAATIQTNTTQASSYNYQVATTGTTDFGSVSRWSSIEGSFGSGTAGTALDLYRIGSAGVTRTGTFTIDDSGTVGFAAPIPEPSSAAFVAAALSLVAVLSRRRRSGGAS